MACGLGGCTIALLGAVRPFWGALERSSPFDHLRAEVLRCVAAAAHSAIELDCPGAAGHN